MAIHRTKRRVLFYSLVGVFLIITPFVIAIAVGYSINIQTLSLAPAGGIFIKTNQAGITIFLDESPYKETSFLVSGALMSAVSPGMHRVRVEKEGYRSWEKNIAVTQGLVSEYRSIMLIPIEPPRIDSKEFSILNPFQYYPSPHRIRNAIVIPKELTLMIQDIESGKIIFEKKIKQVPRDIEWIDDDNLLVRINPDDGEAGIFRISSDETIHELTINFLKTIKRQTILEVRSHPTDEKFLFILGRDHVIYRYRIADGLIEPVIDQAVHFEIYDQRIGFITKNGFFATANLDGKDIQIIGRPGFFVNGVFSSYPSEKGGIIAFVDGVGGFFIFQDAERRIEPITAGVNRISFDTKKGKALLQRENDILVLFLLREGAPPFRERMSFEKLTKEMKQPIIDSAWYDNDYALFTTSEGLFGAEIGIKSDDYTIQKISSEGGYLSTNRSAITVINGKGLFRYAIE